MTAVRMVKREKWGTVVSDWVLTPDALVIETSCGLLCWQGSEKQSQCPQNIVAGVAIVQGSVRQAGAKVKSMEERREVESARTPELCKHWWSDKLGVYSK